MSDIGHREKKYAEEDTIAAVATPPGEGGIGIIRISGSKAEEILNRIFRAAHPENAANRRMM